MVLVRDDADDTFIWISVRADSEESALYKAAALRARHCTETDDPDEEGFEGVGALDRATLQFLVAQLEKPVLDEDREGTPLPARPAPQPAPAPNPQFEEPRERLRKRTVNANGTNQEA